MSNPSALAALEYEAESAFAEAVTTFATHRLPIRVSVDTSGLKHPLVEPDFVQQYMQGGSPRIRGVQGGSSIKTSFYLTGHGVASDRLAASGRGESDPVAGNDSAAGRQQNRRVQVHISDDSAASR